MVAVGTWNLYRPGGRFGPKTRAADDAKLGTLAATITRLAPDVLAVQEVGQPEALADLVDLLGGSWTAVLSEHPDARGIRVGFLSTVEPVSTAQVVDFPGGLRPIQKGDAATDSSAAMGRAAGSICEWTVQGTDWDLLTVHLKSKLLRAAGSPRRTRISGPGSVRTRCTGEPVKRPPSGAMPTRCWPGRARTAR